MTSHSRIKDWALAALAAAAMHAAVPAKAAGVEEELRALEERRREAIKSGDFATLAQIYAPGFFAIAGNGQVIGREQLFAIFRQTDPALTFTTDEIRVIDRGETALFFGHLRALNANGGVLFGSRFTHLFVREGNRWICVFGQSTAVPQKPADIVRLSAVPGAIDLSLLWDFAKPELSEERFRTALVTATGDEALILQTQIARTYGLRRDFARARQILKDLEPRIAGAGTEARARHALELGRTLSSATHPRESQTEAAKTQARAAYLQALEIARAAGHDDLAIDALHMLAFVDTAPADQLKWGREALAVVEKSSQPAAKRWEGSLRNNIGLALHGLGRHEEALTEFRRALALREQAGKPGPVRIAHWMMAWTLRSLNRLDEALEIQLRLERESQAAGAPDPHVFEELEKLYRAKGDETRAQIYAKRRIEATK